MAERYALVLVNGRVREIASGDTLVGVSAPLKIVYNNENLVIPDNIQVTGHNEISFLGTGELQILGSGSLAII